MIRRKDFENCLNNFLHLVKDTFENNDNYLHLDDGVSIIKINKEQVCDLTLGNFDHYLNFFIAIE